MKKYFLSLVAMAAAMLFATSCQESLVEPQVGGPTTFTIEIPGQMGTKALNETYNLYVEVYKDNGTDRLQRIGFDDDLTITSGQSKTFSLDLVATQEYDIVFWAQKAGAYGVDNKLTNVDMDIENHHNSEDGAAYYAILNNFKPSEDNPSVSLKRPFAQLNIGTLLNVSYSTTPTKINSAEIKVSQVASEFNRVDFNGTMGVGQEPPVDYIGSGLPYSETVEVLNVGGKDYSYVSMDYLPVIDNKGVVDVTVKLNVEDPYGVSSEITRTIKSVPLQMNYKTNIVGNLITSATDFTITIDESWNTPNNDKEVEFREVATAEELQDAIEAGVDNITLTDDIELTGTLEFKPVQGPNPIARTSTNETSFVLDLNNKTLKGSIQVHGGVALTVNNGIIRSENPDYSGIESVGNLTLNNVTISSNRHAVRIEAGYAVINGGNYTLIPYANRTQHALNVSGESNVIVKNGSFIGPKGTESDSGSAVNVQNGSTVTIECGDFSGGKEKTLACNADGFLYVKGGEFDQDPAGWVAEGYIAVEVAGRKSYVVLPDTDDYDIAITDPAQLTNDVIENNETIYLAAGEYTIELYTNITNSPSRNLTIIGTEGTKVKFANQQVRLALFKNFTIKNCEILHMATKSWGMLVFGSGNKEDGEYTIENCTFNGVGTQGIYINEEKTRAKYNIINCTFNGNFGGEGAITIQPNKDVEHIVNVERCEFNKIPATSHRIFLAPYDGKKALFYGFTLNTDLKATTAYELEMFLKLGKAQLGCDLTFSASETSANSGYGATGVEVADDAVLDGQGHTLTVNNAWGTWDCVVAAKGGRIENLTVSGAMRGIFMPGAKGHVYIDNVIFDNVIYTFNSDAGDKDYGVYISNSTLNGWTSFSNAHKEVVFTNCTFGEGSGNAFCRPYNACVFENCEFSTDMEFDTSKVANIVFKNCTYGGVKITAENAASLKTGEVTFFYNGVGSVSFE